jgi:hypothetical protein
MTCGATKSIPGGTSLVCARDASHAGPHAVLHLGQPLAQWGEGIGWSADDQARFVDRHTWHKRHVRRAYQTLAMWKAGR